MRPDASTVYNITFRVARQCIGRVRKLFGPKRFKEAFVMGRSAPFYGANNEQYVFVDFIYDPLQGSLLLIEARSGQRANPLQRRHKSCDFQDKCLLVALLRITIVESDTCVNQLAGRLRHTHRKNYKRLFQHGEQGIKRGEIQTI